MSGAGQVTGITSSGLPRVDLSARALHSVGNVGDSSAAEMATYSVEKGKPFLVVVA